MTTTVYLQSGKEEAKRIIRSFFATLVGKSQPTELAQGVFYAIGFAALSDIHADFVRKARGEVGEDGNRWPRLSPKTLAYSRRFGPGEKSALKKAAGLGRAHRLAPGGKVGLLTVAQLERWREIYGTRLARFAAKMPLKAAKALAAQIAWATIKREGAKTMLEVYGNRPHEPLRDTGILLNSLSLGQLSGGSYSPPTLPGGEHQVFQSLINGIIVGTNVPYARTHNEGNPAKKIPARRFIPREVPQVWIDRWLAVGMQSISIAMEHSLRTGAV